MSWEEVKARLAQARTPEERRAAAAALAREIPPEHREKLMVSMQKGGVTAVRLGDLNKAMQNPSVYDRVRKIITGR